MIKLEKLLFSYGVLLPKQGKYMTPRAWHLCL